MYFIDLPDFVLAKVHGKYVPIRKVKLWLVRNVQPVGEELLRQLNHVGHIESPLNFSSR